MVVNLHSSPNHAQERLGCLESALGQLYVEVFQLLGTGTFSSIAVQWVALT